MVAHDPEEPPAEAPEESKERLCLRCRQSFGSSWAGERICPTCKRRKTWGEGRNWLPGAYEPPNR